MTGRRTAVLVILLCAVATLGACTSGGVILGTRDSACFRVLPSARKDVGSAPKFAGVRHLPPHVLVDYMEQAHGFVGTVPSQLETHPGAACLVAFQGSFVPTSVRRGWAPTPGPYRVAIVAVDESTDRILATVLLRSGAGPLDFIHRFAFQR